MTENNFCYVLCTTLKEYKNGYVHNFFDKIRSLIVDKENCDFICTFDNLKEVSINLDEYQCMFINKIKIVDLKINDKDNIYFDHRFDNIKLKYEPPLGHSSGPNLSFIKTMEYMITLRYLFKYIVFMECDSWFINKNFNKIIDNIISRKNKFIIKGSYYKGNTIINDNEWWKYHLNGVAIPVPAILSSIFLDKDNTKSAVIILLYDSAIFSAPITSSSNDDLFA